ncbi:DMT family transporter [uncultured Friedmanniella sp.]|uniref:DMT family transporter n=1 Tax=uncultured Friedmanniella sp. TaxID=335381 RepID=UPI0035C9D2C4
MSHAPAARPPASGQLPSSAASPAQPLRWWVTLPMMLGSGALIALQSEVNGDLAGRLGTGLRAVALAAVISFGGGLVVLTVLALARRSIGRGVVDLLRAVVGRRVPLWLVVGGLGGAFFVASQGIAARALGITFFVLCFVAGQAVMALLVDHRGWGPNAPAQLSAGRLVGAAMAVLAVAVSGAGMLSALPLTAVFVVLAALPLVAGAANSLQQGMNGRVASRFGSWVTTWNNFFVGTLGLLVFLLVTLALPGRVSGLPARPWLYLGGLCGIGFIWASSVTVRIHGVLVVGVFAVAGQVLTAAVLSLLTDPSSPSWTTWLAVLISLVGAAVVGLSGRHSAP